MMALIFKYRLAFIGFLVGGLVCSVICKGYWGAVVSDIQADYAQEKLEASAEREKALKAIQAQLAKTQNNLLQLDAVKSEELTHARSENDRLRTLYSAADTDRKRLRIATKTRCTSSGVSADSSTGPMGDAGSVELSDAAGSAVWHLRQTLIDNEAKITYLQEYICTIRPDPVLCSTK